MKLDDRVILGDIRNIINHLDDFITNEIDVVIGGPPCQGFSSANQQRIIDDPRNELYKYYLKAISKIAPKFVVMENVKDMLPYAQQVVEDYKNIRAIKENKTFYEDKINTAKYYFEKILPRVQSHYLSAITGSDTMMKSNFN